MGKSTSYENKQTKLMATVAVHQTRWQLFVCHKENFPLCFALTRPCLMWLISHQMKITHLLTVATAFETMLLFSGNVKDLKNYLLEMRTLYISEISEIRIVKGFTLHDIKQFLFTMISGSSAGQPVAKGRSVVKTFANDLNHLEWPACW